MSKKCINISNDTIEEAQALNKKALILNAINVTHLHDFSDKHIDQMLQNDWTYTGNVVAKREDNLMWILKALVGWRKLLEQKKDKVIFTRTANDIISAKKEEKLAVSLLLDWWHPSMAIESAGLDMDLDLMWMLYELGIRQIHPVYYSRSIIGDGFAEETIGRDGGLSIYGRKLINTMNEYNMLLDLSHASNKTLLDACDITNEPAIFSHGGCREIFYHQKNKKTKEMKGFYTRNISDEGIKAIAETGGCISIIDWMPLVKEQPPKPTIEDYVNNVKHVVDLVGIDYVAMGLDHHVREGKYDVIRGRLVDKQLTKEKNFAGKGTLPILYTPRTGVELYDNVFPDYCLTPLTAKLITEGLSELEITKFLGNNLLRVFKKVWK